MTECTHGGDEATCPPCRTALGKDKREPLPWSRPFTALFSSTCRGCWTPIQPGDDMRSCHAFVDTQYVHDGCEW